MLQDREGEGASRGASTSREFDNPQLDKAIVNEVRISGKDGRMRGRPRERIRSEEMSPQVTHTDKVKATEVVKPWKQKKKVAQTANASDDIEIFEGRTSASGPSVEITSPEDGYLNIICKGEFEFVVPRKVVECFQCVDVILHSDAVFKEKLENIIRFPDIHPEVMDCVIRFVFMEHLNKMKAAQYWGGANTPRLVFQFEVKPEQVMDLIYVAHFLGIKDLLNVGATMVARHLRDVPDVSSMPMDLAWCVAEQFTAQELYDAEERQDFLGLNLSTEILWEKHCKKFLFEDIVMPISASARYPSYDGWGLCEGPPPTSWKSLYIALALQQVADRQDGGGNTLFFEEVQHKGKYAYSHTVRPMFYEWVMSAPGSLSLVSYLALFPSLLSLNLAKLPLGKPLTDGSIPCLVIGEILQSLPFLQLLDLSETGLTAEAAIHLSKSLQSHSRLQVLRLACNGIKTEGFSAIARALPFARTVKMLDVRENEIRSSMAEDAVASIQASSLEELLLEGNLKACKRISSKADHIGKACNGTFFTESGSSQGNWIAVPEPEKAQGVPYELLVPALSAVPLNLKKLQLARCDLLDTDVEILMQAMSQYDSIQELDLSDNKITAAGAVVIFNWLQQNTSLLELSLANNKITDSCSRVLKTILETHTRLQKLSMSGNYYYGEGNLPETDSRQDPVRVNPNPTTAAIWIESSKSSSILSQWTGDFLWLENVPSIFFPEDYKCERFERKSPT